MDRAAERFVVVTGSRALDWGGAICGTVLVATTFLPSRQSPRTLVGTALVGVAATVYCAIRLARPPEVLLTLSADEIQLPARWNLPPIRWTNIAEVELRRIGRHLWLLIHLREREPHNVALSRRELRDAPGAVAIPAILLGHRPESLVETAERLRREAHRQA